MGVGALALLLGCHIARGSGLVGYQAGSRAIYAAMILVWVYLMAFVVTAVFAVIRSEMQKGPP